jgi:pimeloyl-ACP methyl ester carboxylesterase
MSNPFKIEVGGRTTRVRVDGEPASAPVVLLHGVGRSRENWSAVLPNLSTRYRVLALDIPGFGFSERRPGPVSLASLALGVLETLDALGEQRPVHLIGNSLGGAIALQIQAVAPDRTASLVLVDAAGFGSEVAMMLRLVGAPVVGRLLTARTTAFSVRQAERATYADPALVTRTRVEHALAIAAQPGYGAMMHETAHALTALGGVRTHGDKHC